MALAEDGSFLRSVSQTAPGRRVTVALADGRLVTVVDSIEPCPALSSGQD